MSYDIHRQEDWYVIKQASSYHYYWCSTLGSNRRGPFEPKTQETLRSIPAPRLANAHYTNPKNITRIGGTRMDDQGFRD